MKKLKPEDCDHSMEVGVKIGLNCLKRTPGVTSLLVTLGVLFHVGCFINLVTLGILFHVGCFSNRHNCDYLASCDSNMMVEIVQT